MARRVPLALIAVGLVLLVVTLGIGGLAGEVPDCLDGNVLDLELAGSESRAVELLGTCDAAGQEVLRDALVVDTWAFMPLYVVATAFWCVVAVRRLPWKGEWRRRVVVAAVPAIVVAAALDAVENHHLGTVVDAAGASEAIGAATTASYGKWLLVLFAVPTSLVAMVRCIRGRGVGGSPA